MLTVRASKEIVFVAAVGVSISIMVAFVAMVISGACKMRKAAQQEAASGRRAPPPAMVPKSDGWPDATCGVCLVELADGDDLRVLPPSMHYFHAACVGDWIRIHATCPLCRGPVAAAAARPALTPLTY